MKNYTKNIYQILVILAVLLFSISSINARTHLRTEQEDPGKNETYEALFDQLTNMSVDTSAVAQVSNIIIKRDVGEFILSEGTLAFCKPINDRVCGAYFYGTGIFSFIPPVEIEKLQLRRFYETDTLYREFTSLFIIFGDSTVEELQQKLTFESGLAPKKAKNERRHFIKYLSDKKSKYFNSDIIETLLNDDTNDLFHARINGGEKLPLFFKIKPYAEEQVKLYRRNPEERFNDYFETICSFPLNHNQSKGYDYPNQYDTSYVIDKYVLDCTFEDNLDLNGIAKLHIKSKRANQKWILFKLYRKLTVDSIKWSDDQDVDFFKNKEGSSIWAKCPTPITLDQKDSLTIYYKGEVIDRTTHWFILDAPHYWYPQTNIREKTYYDMTFHIHKDYQFACVGEKIEESIENKIVTTRWITLSPIKNCSFNLGFFKEHIVEDDRIPKVTILMSEMGHHEMEQALIADGILSGKNMEEQVAADVANSMVFYKTLFGDCPVSNFYATEISQLHGGEAFPGLIHLSIMTFQRTDREGYHQSFRAHEVAHQWWGIGVDRESYHDKWLSEGLSEYSSLWYLQWALKDNKSFFKQLENTRKNIIDEYQQKYSSDHFLGPVWLGTRVGSSQRSGGYSTIVYDKGAWVFHMLRNLMIDLKTMKEDMFLNMIQDYYATFRGKYASTRDFQALVEKHIGGDMQWFFDQWVYGVEIPKYKFSYKLDKNDEGKYIATCRVKQEKISGNFKMYVPIKIDFGKDQFARLRVFIEGPETTFQLPILPQKPKKLIFNDLESVLCEVDTEKWKD